MDAYVTERFQSTDPNIVDVFTGLKDPILRSDLLRYLILLREGGVWADIDVLPHRPVAEWVPEQYRGRVNLVVGIETDHHKRPVWSGLPYSVVLAQFAVLAKPGHPALRVLVDRVVADLERLMDRKRPGDAITFEDVMATTGPFQFTDVLMQYFKNVTGVEQTGDDMDWMKEPKLIGDVLVLPKDSFGWLPHENTHPKDDPTVLVEHIFISTWRASHPG
jgi:mannosyltransferase OCH1-like enzyme